jgi:hypothetical protein
MKREASQIAFDFEVGDVTRSPCRSCSRRRDFPGCMETCQTLDRFQRVLAKMVSCVRDSCPESYSICRPRP